MPFRPRNRRRLFRQPLRWAIETMVLLAIAAAITSEFLLDGWIRPIIVSSGSMAPAVLGPHRRLRCGDCGMEFDCDADASLSAVSAACPNCGHRDIPLDSDIVTGDRLFVDRARFAVRSPRRWEVALFRCPELADDYCVKRIVGLPGETVEIRGGDVFIDGTIARKSLDEQRRMAVLVHDTAWSGDKSELPSRWSPQPADGWQAAGSGFRSAENGSPTKWLNYTHWRRGPGSAAAIEESPVLDEDGYNPSVSRPLNPVTDLMLVVRLTAVGNGTLFLKANDGRRTYQVAIEPATGGITLLTGENVLRSLQIAPRSFDRPSEIIVSVIDRQILLAIDGRECRTYLLAATDEPTRPSSTPFSIGNRGLQIEISRLQIWRDVYYTSPRTAASQPTALGPHEYFVLGDNSPISRDSRPWTGGAPLPAALLIGLPLRFSSSGDGLR